eukprot:6178823-Pleurochrysis_carterae.AAC.1
MALMEEMSASQLSEHLLRHRQSHAGKEKHAELEMLLDHGERAPSLLHHRINSCATSIAVTAPTSVKKRMNAVLESYVEHWAFATSKTQRDTRPSGNESRNLLTKPGLLTGLLQARYASSDSETLEALDALGRAQQSAARVCAGQMHQAAAAPVAVGKKKKRRRVLE